jgi:hypothetical protein
VRSEGTLEALFRGSGRRLQTQTQKTSLGNFKCLEQDFEVFGASGIPYLTLLMGVLVNKSQIAGIGLTYVPTQFIRLAECLT